MGHKPQARPGSGRPRLQHPLALPLRLLCLRRTDPSFPRTGLHTATRQQQLPGLQTVRFRQPVERRYPLPSTTTDVLGHTTTYHYIASPNSVKDRLPDTITDSRGRAMVLDRDAFGSTVSLNTRMVPMRSASPIPEVSLPCGTSMPWVVSPGSSRRTIPDCPAPFPRLTAITSHPSLTIISSLPPNQ